VTFPLPAITKAITGWLSGAGRAGSSATYPSGRSLRMAKGDIPIVNLRFKCENCGSRLTDCVVSGSHLTPRAGLAFPNIAVLAALRR
jgi:hypothetical protein